MDNNEPTAYKEAMMGPDSVKWLDTIESMIVSIYIIKLLNLVDPPEGIEFLNVYGSYKDTDVDVHIHKKSRHVGKGFTMMFKELTTTRFDLP